jgi:hypothetical protein
VSHFGCSQPSLLSLLPEKEAKSRCTGSRLSYFWKAGRASRPKDPFGGNRNPRDASRRTCLRKRLAHASPAKPAVFLTHASLLSHIAADSEHVISAFVGLNRNRWVCAGVGFTRRVSISGHKHKDGIFKQYSCAEIDGMCGWD